MGVESVVVEAACMSTAVWRRARPSVGEGLSATVLSRGKTWETPQLANRRTYRVNDDGKDEYRKKYRNRAILLSIFPIYTLQLPLLINSSSTCARSKAKWAAPFPLRLRATQGPHGEYYTFSIST